MAFLQKANSTEMGDENKTKNITSLWRGISQVGRAERGKGEKEIG